MAEDLEPQTVTEGTEEGEPTIEPSPDDRAAEEMDLEEGPEPTEDWAEDEDDLL